MIGFPRSGTTLLDTILNSHQDIEVIEEQPMIQDIERFLDIDNIKNIEMLSKKDLLECRKIYFSNLSKNSNSKNTKNIIDKLPLNILHIPTINKLFPNAKYILSVRHPFDSIISCYMQNFALNHYMSFMNDLKKLVNFYCLTMDIFVLCKERYDIDCKIIKYEKLLDNFEEEINSLLHFLNLSWDDNISNYREKAINKKINTPSYSQVIKPIYRTSINQWKFYKDELVLYSDKIKPWINYFNYGRSGGI
tara:strand:- start:335 stop:1081 length:747 start_codon:yes stop_codon:yes gene_type:complete